MSKVVWAFLLACVWLQPAWSADLTVTGRGVHSRTHVHVFPRRVELVYPRSVTFVSNGRFVTPHYSCWAWTPGGRLRLVPMDWSAPCAGSPHYAWEGSEALFVEHVRIH